MAGVRNDMTAKADTRIAIAKNVIGFVLPERGFIGLVLVSIVAEPSSISPLRLARHSNSTENFWHDERDTSPVWERVSAVDFLLNHHRLVERCFAKDDFGE